MFSKQQQQHELPAALFRQCNLNRNPIKSTAGMCRQRTSWKGNEFPAKRADITGKWKGFRKIQFALATQCKCINKHEFPAMDGRVERVFMASLLWVRVFWPQPKEKDWYRFPCPLPALFHFPDSTARPCETKIFDNLISWTFRDYRWTHIASH